MSAIGRDAGIGSEDFEVAAVSDHRSAFHGQRMPLAQPGTVNAAIKQTLAGLAETAGVAYISEVTQNADGTYQVEIRTRGKAGQANGPTLTLRAKACSLTGSDVGRGAVNRDTGEATVEISDRAVSRAVPRALAHAIAVAAAILDGSAARATILADQVLSAENLADLSAVSPDLSAVSPEDRARLAELRYEAGQLGSLNPVRSWRAAREVTALMRLLGLVAGTPSLERPGEFENQSTDYRTRLRALSMADLTLVGNLNDTVPQVGSLPAAVAGTSTYVVKGALSALVFGVVPAGVLSFAALASAEGRLATVAAVVGVSGIAGSIATTMAERRHARRTVILDSRREGTLPPAERRAVLDLQAGQLERQVSDTLRRVREIDLFASPDARDADRAAADGTLVEATALDGLPLDVAVAASSAAAPTADQRISKRITVPPLGSWIMRHAGGRVIGFFAGLAAHEIAVSHLGLASYPQIIQLLGVVIGASVITAFSQRWFARKGAEAEDLNADAKQQRQVHRVQARTDPQLRDARRNQTTQEGTAAYRQALAGRLATAEQALVDSADEPATVQAAVDTLRTEALALSSSLEMSGPSRAADLADRAATVEEVAVTVKAKPDSTFIPDGRRRSHSGRVERQARATLSQLGAPDRVVFNTTDQDGIVELEYENQKPVRISVVAVPAKTLSGDHSVVAEAHWDGGTNSYRVSVSDQASEPTVGRAVLTALDQVLGTRPFEPTGRDDQLLPGPTIGPIDPADLTANDHDRVAKITRLLDSLDGARPWSRRRPAAEYQAALRAAGLDVLARGEGRIDAYGGQRRRQVLDRDLLARLEARDPLPAKTASLRIHLAKTLFSVLPIAVGIPVFLGAANGLAAANLLRMGIGAVSPLFVGTVTAIAEWRFNSGQEARERGLEIGNTKPSSHQLALEQEFVRSVIDGVEDERRHAEVAEELLTQRRRTFQAALSHAAAKGLLPAESLPDILDALSPPNTPAADPATTGQDDGAPDPDGLPGPDSRDADRAHQSANEPQTDVDRTGQRAKVTGRKPKAPRHAYAGLILVPRVVAAGVTIGLFSLFGPEAFGMADIFRPGQWGKLGNDDYLQVLAGSLLGGMAAVASTLTAVGGRKVGDATADAENVRDAQLSTHVELRRGGLQEVRLAPLKLAQQLAEARLADALDGVNRKKALPEPRSDQVAHDEVNDPSGTHPPDSGNPPPPRGDLPSSPDDGPTDPAPNVETEEEFFERMRREVNTTGWDDDDSWCACRLDLPCGRELPRLPVPPDQGPHTEHDGPAWVEHCPPTYIQDLPPVPPPCPPARPPPLVDISPPTHVTPPVEPAPDGPPADTAPPGSIGPNVRWFEFTDPWGNQHLIAIIEWVPPGGDCIRLLVWLVFPAGSSTPVVILAELVGRAPPLAIREHISAVADSILPLLVEQAPRLDPLAGAFRSVLHTRRNPD